MKVNNTKFPKRKAIVKTCALCNKDFTGNKKKYCSRRCKDEGGRWTVESVLKLIQEFEKKNGRIPMKREIFHYHAIRGRFGTWNNAIIAAGFTPNPVRFAQKHAARDGHVCDSVAEMIIDNWFTKNNISHEHHKKYPGDLGFTSDFFVKGYWIEFFGLDGELKAYDRVKKRKLDFIRESKLPLIELYSYDLFPKLDLDIKLKVLR